MSLWQPERFWHPVRVMSWPSEERWSLAEGQLSGLSSPCFRKGAESRRRHGARGAPSLFVLPGRARWDAGLVPHS
jgi:hypothetical protein